MDTSVSASDVSITDFIECRKVLRKRKRKLAPLSFAEDPLDATFYSPTRPMAAQNPLGAPAVDVLQTSSWISLDEFGRTPATRLRTRREPSSRGRGDVITCSRTDCANPRHAHDRPPRQPIELSDNDSDLLLTIDDTGLEKPHGSGSGKIKQTLKTKTDSDKCLNISVPGNGSVCQSPVVESPAKEETVFKKVGYSQCKSGKTKKRTQKLAGLERDLLPVPFIPGDRMDKENCLRRKVVFDSPCKTPTSVPPGSCRTPNNAPRAIPKHLDTPESGPGVLYVEDTPEHLVGLRMVTRRLRRVLGQSVPDSLHF